MKQESKNWQIKLGIFMMIFSGVFFAATFVIPMFNLPSKTKIIAITTSLVLMEVVFWVGGLLVGKKLFAKYKQNLNPKNWFIKKNI
jgi:VIT1/CCC1 family predicted Fe2+/Mn2+ transporter